MCCCQGRHEGLRADEVLEKEMSRLQLCWSVDTPVCLGIMVCRLCLWGMQTIGTIFESVANIFIFADPLGGRAAKSSLPFCLQNNQHCRRKQRACTPLFLNAYPPNTGMTFLIKVTLGIWMFYICRVSGNDEDYKVTAEVNKNKSVSLENIS